MNLIETLRPEARSAPVSGIVEVANHGRGQQGLIPLWVGEGDMPTPAFITDAATAALAGGETFYTWQKGIPELRQALARYYQRHFGKPFHEEEFIVTGSGMHAIQLALAALAGKGEEVVYLSPAWPNFAAAAGVAGAKAVPVVLDHSGNGWSCDVDRIEAAVTDKTRAIFVNSPSNPTGWTADRQTLQAILDLARRKRLWIIADEIYSLFHSGHGRAPSFLDIAAEDDRILFVNSFSKNWAMTGWRVGWMRIHPFLQQIFENLIQYSNSGVAQFMQTAPSLPRPGRGFIAAVNGRGRRAIAVLHLAERQGPFCVPKAFYCSSRSTASATRALPPSNRRNANVGLAPGTAFGPGGEAFFRLCFHRRLDQIEEAAHRLAKWIRTT